MKQIREAVGWARAEVELLYGYDDVLNKNTKEMLNILIDLAEKVLAVKMPEKKEKIPYKMEDYDDTPEDEYSSGWDGGIVDGYNQAIDDCQIAITGILEDLQQIVIEDVPHQYQDRLLEKLGGVR